MMQSNRTKDAYGSYRGRVTIRVRHPDGTVDTHEYTNLVHDGYYSHIADLAIGATTDTLSYIGIGDSTTARVASDTTLGNELFRKVFITRSSPTPAGRIELNFTIGGGEALFTWKELGIFTKASGGVLTNSLTVDFTHTAEDVIDVEWIIERS